MTSSVSLLVFINSVFYSTPGVWIVHVYFGEEEVKGSPLQLRVHDPQKAWLSGPEDGFAGELLVYKGMR